MLPIRRYGLSCRSAAAALYAILIIRHSALQQEHATLKNIPLVLVLLTMGVAAGNPAQTPASVRQPVHVTERQVTILARKAHSSEQFRELARDYAELQTAYLRKAADEKREWDRRVQLSSGSSAKYPSSVDSAHQLYDLFVYKAALMGRRAEMCKQLAAGTTVSSTR